MVLFLSVLPLFLIIVVIFYYHKKNYWTRKNIPGPPTRLFFGNFIELSNPFTLNVLVLQKWTKIYGPVYGVQEGLRNVLVISDPEIIQEVFVRKFDCFFSRKLNSMANDSNKGENVQLFNATGSKWKRLRYLSNNIFGIGNLKTMFPTIHKHVHILVTKLATHSSKHPIFDIIPFFQEFSMNLIVELTFGIDYSSDPHQKNPFSDDILKAFDRSPDREISIICASLPSFKNFVNKTRKMFYSSNLSRKVRIIKKLTDEVLSKKENGYNANDRNLIGLFLSAEVAEIDEMDSCGDVHQKFEKHLSTEEIVAQCFVILLAGFGAVSASLSFLVNCLTVNQDAQQNLYDEICGSGFEIGESMKYLDVCIKESLRLYPVAARSISRLCTKDTKLGNMEIEKGTYVMVDVFSVHRDEKIWGCSANKFDPERKTQNLLEPFLYYQKKLL